MLFNRYFIFYLFILLINSFLTYQSNLKSNLKSIQFTSNIQVFDISQEIKGDIDHKKA
jgi:hypothetical protein